MDHSAQHITTQPRTSSLVHNSGGPSENIHAIDSIQNNDPTLLLMNKNEIYLSWGVCGFDVL